MNNKKTPISFKINDDNKQKLSNLNNSSNYLNQTAIINFAIEELYNNVMSSNDIKYNTLFGNKTIINKQENSNDIKDNTETTQNNISDTNSNSFDPDEEYAAFLADKEEEEHLIDVS